MVSTKELKNIAKEKKLKNYHNLSKEDLSRMLKIPIFLTKRYYQNIAKDRNLKNYHNLKKADLIQLLNMNPEIPISEKPIPAPRKTDSRKTYSNSAKNFRKTYSSTSKNSRKTNSRKTHSSTSKSCRKTNSSASTKPPNNPKSD